jgi:hypothetical protein
MPAIAQDDYLIQAAIAYLLADADVSGIVGTDVYQKDTELVGVTPPYVTVGFDFESKVLGISSNRGTFTVICWYADSPSTNITLLRQLAAEVRRLFDVEHAVSSILSYKSGLKLRYSSLRDSPVLVDTTDNLYWCPAEFDAILDT